jgi:hypothetical protein
MLCERCGGRLDRVLVELGERAHPCCLFDCRDPRVIKRAARAKVRQALRKGVLTRPDRCEQCGGGGRIDGHHDDYAQPLAVRWLCRGTCHPAQHARSRSGQPT